MYDLASKGKKNPYFCVMFNRYITRSGIQVAATCQPAPKTKIHLQWKTTFMTLRINNQNYRGKAYFQCTIIRR